MKSGRPSQTGYAGKLLAGLQRKMLWLLNSRDLPQFGKNAMYSGTANKLKVARARLHRKMRRYTRQHQR